MEPSRTTKRLIVAAMLAASAHAQTLSTLYTFSGPDGAGPQAPVTLGNNDNFYGTTSYSASVADGYGTVFMITPSGGLTTVYKITGGSGTGPQAGVTLGSDGNYYGTSPGSDDPLCGTVFKITPSGASTIIYTFTNTLVGCTPGALIQDANGNLYGPTLQGGNNEGEYANQGTIFQITTSGALTTLYDFSSEGGGWGPVSLTLGPDGNFYGTTSQGGNEACFDGCGSFFMITPGGTLTFLYSFSGPDGEYPGPLTLGNDGNFYGITPYGGSSCAPYGCGTIFKITPSGVLTTLHSFSGTDGLMPEAALTLGADGNFYGSTSGGHPPQAGCLYYGCGTLFEITPTGVLTTIHVFGGADGATPEGALTLGADGNFYGTTYSGGTFGAACAIAEAGCGTVFKWCLPGGAKACTITAISSSLTPSTYGDSVTFSVTVTPASGSAVPTGSVSFAYGAIPLGSALLTGGAASLTTTAVPAEHIAVIASYSGDANYQPSSGSVLQYVYKSATTATVTPNLNPSVYNQSVTFTASVEPTTGAGIASGKVVFKNGSSTLGSATLAKGSASITPRVLSPGTYSIVASYNGDANCLASASPVLSQVVHQATTAVELKSSGNPALANQQVTFTAKLTGQYGGSPTGTVTFSANGTQIGSPVQVASRAASITTSFADADTYSVTAAYSGDANFTSGSAPPLSETVYLTVQTATTVKSSGSPSALGAPVAFTATVKPIVGSIPNGGTVTFYDGTASIGTGATASGAATFRTSSLAAGTHSITAAYAGDATYQPSASAVVKQVVSKNATTTSLTSGLNPSTYGESVTFTAKVISSGATPTGTVTFKNGSAAFGTGTLSAGVAALTYTRLAAGADFITAVYGGDANSLNSASAPLSQSVAPAATATSVTSSKNPSNQGQSVTFTATVTSAYATPTGSVTFTQGSTTLGTVTLAGGKARLAIATLPAGSDTLTATYVPATPPNFVGSFGSILQAVN